MKMKSLWMLLLSCGVVVGMWVAPRAAAQSSSSGPELTAAMQSLQAAMSALPTTHWVTSYHDSADNTNWSYAFDYTVSHVVADPKNCSVVYHYVIQRDGTASSDKDGTMALHDVVELEGTTGAERTTKNNVAAGHTTWSVSMTPVIYDLVIRGPQQPTKLEWYFLFTDKVSADNMAKTLSRAVALCGGSATVTGDE